MIKKEAIVENKIDLWHLPSEYEKQQKNDPFHKQNKEKTDLK